MPRLLPSAIAAGALVLLLAGCSASGTSHDSGVPDSGEVSSADGGVEAVGADADADRSVVTTGRMSLTADDPIETAEAIADLASDAGGRVDHRSESPGTDSEPADARLELRIPAEELDGVVEDLRGLGEVTSVSMDSADVTQERADLEGRIAALSASVARLTALLGQATSTTELIEIESELTTRQAELDSLTHQRDVLVDQVEFSTLSVSVVTEDVAPDARPDTFADGFAAGWDALAAFGAGLLVVIGVLLPWLAVLAVLGAIVVGIVLLATRRKRRPPQA